MFHRVLPDLMGRTLQIVNEREELVCFIQKSTKALIMEVRACVCMARGREATVGIWAHSSA